MSNSLSVSITADVSDLKVKLALAQDTLKTTSAEVRKLAQVANTGNMTAALQADLQKATGAAEKARLQVASLSKEVRSLSTTGSPFAGLTKGLEDVKGAAAQLGSIRATVMGLGEAAAAAFAVDEIQKAVEHAVDYGAEIARTAKIIGVTTDFLQEFNFAAKQSEVDVGAADDGLKGLNASLGAVQANLPRAKQLAVTFEALGFTPDQLRGYRDAGELLPVLADRIKALSSAAERAAIVRKLGIEQLLPLLDKGGAGFNTLTQRARDLGVVMDASLVKQSEAAKEKLNEVDQVTQAKLNIGMAAFAGTLLKVKEGFAGAEIAALHFLATVTGTLSPLQKTKDDLKDYNHLMQVAHVGPGGIGMYREVFDEMTKKLKADTAALREWNQANKAASAESSGSGPAGAAAAPQLVPDKPKKSRSGGGSSDAGDESDMQALEERFKQEQNAHNTMITNMLAAELAYWSNVKTNVQGGALTAKDAATVREKVGDLTHQVAMQGIEEEFAARRNADEDAIADIQQRAAKQKNAIEQQIKDVEEAEKAGVITHQAATDKILALIADEKKAATDAANAILAIKTATDTFIAAKADAGTAQFKEAQRDQVTAARSAGNEIVAADDQAADAIEARSRQVTAQRLADQKKAAEGWKQTNEEIMAAEDQLVSGILSGKESMSQIAFNIGKDLVQKEIANDLHYLTEHLLLNAEVGASDQATSKGGLAVHLIGELMKTAATVTGTQTRVAAASLGDMQTAAIASASNVKEVGGAAAVGAANAYKALAGVPIIGPALGAAAATATFGAIEAYSAMASFDVGTNYVPRDMPAMVHQGERIIPRADNAQLMDALRGNLGQHGGGQTIHQTINNHYNSTVHAPSPDLEELLENQGHKALAWMREQQRRGRF